MAPALRHGTWATDSGVDPEESETWSLTETEREGCLRCRPNDEESTGGFFVAGFVRDAYCEADPAAGNSTDAAAGAENTSPWEEPEWEGFGSYQPFPGRNYLNSPKHIPFEPVSCPLRNPFTSFDRHNMNSFFHSISPHLFELD
ncbi:hypothetical protein ACJ73_09717 [Blastomyces percursus]|uniref:SAM-dependent MTase RsmB/NOP-type domain-containing protein n=1 Tax=Blastomyces percursus TaxID=1658174 RepID=A0A1J9Q350_9EURO|nr:hypothetical protein ACJ73_09717 [Blastomyces percursus]